MTMNGSTNFQVTPSETKEFYNGLLAEVEPRTLEFFVRRGIARELLFYLFTDRLIEERGGKRRELRNDPLDPSFPDFQKYVRLAMDYGLSSEPLREKGGASKPDGGKTVTINLTDASVKERRQGRPSRNNGGFASTNSINPRTHRRRSTPQVAEIRPSRATTAS